jgi:Tfp pilus assembly protein PilO
MQNIVAVVLIAAAVWIFFGFTDPHYQDAKRIQASIKEYDEALNLAREAEGLRSNLIAKYSSIKKENLDKLQKLLPDSVDNVRLIIDLNAIASRYGLSVSNVKVESTVSDKGNRSSSSFTVKSDYSDESFLETVTLQFSLSGSYDNFKKFLFDVERSLRIVEIVTLGIKPDQPFNTYDLRIKTYWLKK